MSQKNEKQVPKVEKQERKKRSYSPRTEPKGRMHSLRLILNLTQQEFADAIGLQRNTVVNYEHERHFPNVAICMKIIKLAASKGIDINLEYLLNVPGSNNSFRGRRKNRSKSH